MSKRELLTPLTSRDHRGESGRRGEAVRQLDNPRDLGEALAGGKLGAYWKYRVGDWREVYR